MTPARKAGRRPRFTALGHLAVGLTGSLSTKLPRTASARWLALVGTSNCENEASVVDMCIMKNLTLADPQNASTGTEAREQEPTSECPLTTQGDLRIGLTDLVARGHATADFLRELSDHLDRVAFSLEAAPFLNRVFPDDYFEPDGWPSGESRLKRIASTAEESNVKIAVALVCFLSSQSIERLAQLSSTPSVGRQVLEHESARALGLVTQLDRSGRTVIL